MEEINQANQKLNKYKTVKLKSESRFYKTYQYFATIVTILDHAN